MDLREAIKSITSLPLDEQREILTLLSDIEDAKKRDRARLDFLSYVKYMWPTFVEGYHHRIIASLFDDVIAGKKKRIIINMAPRHTKSEFASVFLPSYFLGRFPQKKIIQSSHTAELAVGFGRKVRNLVIRPDYQNLFPGTALSADSKAAGRWATSDGGEYHAIGVGGAVAGKGADLFVIDDPHSEQEAVLAITNPEIYDKTMEWYEGGPRQRLQPGGSIIVVMTRWSIRDLTGQLIKKQMNEPGADQWEVIELPALLPESGEPIWPEFWSLEELLKTKASIPVSKWNAQYQQQPTSEEGALIKREYWRDWEQVKPPDCDIIMQSWDTAFTAGTRSDYSACTTWGVFFNEEEGKNNIILLDAIRGKWEFPELKQKALEHYKKWDPDITLIEARAAGHPLIYELRMMGIPVQDVTVGRGTVTNRNDKISRTNSVTDIFASRTVWANKTMNWSQEVIEECAAFPAGEHDDYLDTVVMAMQRFRQGGWVGTMLDVEEEDAPERVPEYY
jgi:predicted phage terminase large subunit-like protein